MEQPADSVDHQFNPTKGPRELHETSQALQASQELFAKAFHASPDSITITSLDDGRFLEANRGFELITGYTREEVLGRTSLELGLWVNLDDRDTAVSLLRANGSLREFETDIRTKSGDSRRCLVCADLLEFQGQLCSVAVYRNITEMKLAQEQLRASEARYRSVVEGQTEFIVRWKPGGIRTFVNDSYCRFFGLDKEEAIGTSFFGLISEEDREYVNSKIASMTPDNPVASGEHRVICPDGSISWQYWIDRAIYNDTGELVEYQSVGRDVTEQKEAIEALRASEEQYRGVFEGSTNGISIRSLDGTPVEVNPAMCQIHGYTREEYFSLKTSDFVHPDSLKLFREYQETVRQGKPFHAEGKGLHKDGRTIDMELHGSLIQYHGKPHLLVSAQDITDRKRAERNLELATEQLLAERRALEEKNIALQQILDHLEEEKRSYRHEVCDSIEKLLMPVVETLKSGDGRLGGRDIAILESTLNSIIERDIDEYESNLAKLSPRELDIVELIKAGNTSKEISEELNISVQTVHKHRESIRRKLQLSNKAVNLSAYLRNR